MLNLVQVFRKIVRDVVSRFDVGYSELALAYVEQCLGSLLLN